MGTFMSNTKKDRRLSGARLLLSSPETVFSELQESAQQRKRWDCDYDVSIEALLLERDEPLIDLALARYGGSKDVLKTLYERASDASGQGSEYSRQSIRIACLSNQSVTVDHLFLKFPHDIIGEDALHRLLAGTEPKLDDDGFETEEKESGSEIYALLQNPEIDTDFLKSLYRRELPFANFSDRHWMDLVQYTTGNPRLTTCDDNEHGPDMGFYSIHRALESLLEIAPVTQRSMHQLYWLYSGLDSSRVRSDRNIGNILKRWSALQYESKYDEGVHTDLSMKGEFLCLIASLYGEYTDYTSEPSISEVIGTARSDDVALRCAYYANVELSKKEMEAGWERDGSAFLLAALRNNSLYYDQSKRKLLESHLGGSSANYYKKRCEQIHARRKWFDPKPIDSTFLDEDSSNPAETEPTWATKIQGQLQRLRVTTDVILTGCAGVAMFFGSEFLSDQYGLPTWLAFAGLWAVFMFWINKIGPK